MHTARVMVLGAVPSDEIAMHESRVCLRRRFYRWIEDIICSMALILLWVFLIIYPIVVIVLSYFLGIF